MAEGGHLAAPEDVGALMDLLSHDMLNNSQAALTYLELIQSHPGADGKTKEFAERAASQVRTCSMLLDGIRRFVSSTRTGPQPVGAVDLATVLETAAREVTELFPHKRVTVKSSGFSAGTSVLGAQFVHDLFANLFANLVQLDQEAEARIEVGGDCTDGLVNVRVEAPTATLPQGVDETTFANSWPKDASKMARVSGVVFALSITRALGGSARSTVLDPERNRGCVFELSLKRGGAA